MPNEDKSIPFKFFLIFRIRFASFRLGNLTMTLFDPLLGNQWQSSILKKPTSTSSFLKNGELCLPVQNFRLTRGGHLVLNIPVSSTDSYSSTVVLPKQFVPSVLSCLVWRCKILTSFSHNSAWDQIFLYLCLSRLNQTSSDGIPHDFVSSFYPPL